MAGRVFDLSDPAILLPNSFLVDTNIVYERIIATLVPRVPRSTVSLQRLQQLALNASRVTDFFERLRAQDTIGLVGPATYLELIHLVIRELLEQYGNTINPKLSWLRVYKDHPSVLPTMKPILVRIHSALANAGLVFLSPKQLLPIDPRTPYVSQLIDLCCSYALDTGDVELLIEAQRLGIDAIATMDGDFQRAAADFDIYTWI
jgi:predicted nucleic acid-binding protein